jgi:uncharacterized protein YkwD
MPAGPGAAQYATAPARGLRPPPAEPLRRAVLEEVRVAARKLGHPPPEPDARLDWAMTDLARQLRGEDLPALEAVEFLLAHYGLPEPTPHVLLSRATRGGDSRLLEGARAEIAAILKSGPIGRVGVGIDRDADMVYLVVGLQERHVALRGPVARRLPSGGHAAVAARLDAGYDRPALVVTAPDGTVSEQPVPLHDGAMTAELRCRADGRHQVEITAMGRAGAAVLANFPVYCGVAPPAAAPVSAGSRPTAGDPEADERALVALVARDRARAGLPALVVDARLGAIARAHSRDMATNDFVAHVSPRTGTTVDRVHAAGLAPAMVVENVGRAYSADEAEAGFMASPGHRANVLEPRVRRIGVGIVFGAAATGATPLFVTQLMTD